MSEISVPAGPRSLLSPGDNPSCFLQLPVQLLVAPGVPWIMSASLQCLLLSSHSPGPRVSDPFLSSYKDTLR